MEVTLKMMSLRCPSSIDEPHVHGKHKADIVEEDEPIQVWISKKYATFS